LIPGAARALVRILARARMAAWRTLKSLYSSRPEQALVELGSAPGNQVSMRASA